MKTLTHLTFSLILLLSGFCSVAQVAVNTDGSEPNVNAMMDIKSSTMGLLIPRMTTVQRNAFESVLDGDERGMLVFDTDTGGFYFFNGTIFEKLASGVISGISDTDNDTYVETELTPDADQVSFVMDGAVYYTMMPGRIETYNNAKSVFIGDNAGAAQDFSEDRHNIGIGDGALQSNTTGTNNVAIGEGALSPNSFCNSNVAIGVGSLGNSKYKFGIVAIGDSALYNNGFYNSNPSKGYYNTGVGYKVLFANSGGDNNTALGYSALQKIDHGDNNTAVGAFALYEGNYSSSNVAVGYKTLYKNTGFGNTALGTYALRYNTTGKGNVSLGAYGLYGNDTGDGNVALGYSSLENNESGNYNVAIGYRAAYKLDIQSNIIAIGDSALYNNGNDPSYGSYAVKNLAIGSNALCENTYGSLNTAIGYESLRNNVSGDRNTAVGVSALFTSSESSGCIAIGYKSLYSNSDGSSNIAVGNECLSSNTSGIDNVAIGSSSMKDNLTGFYNTAVGVVTLFNNTTGSGNLALGNRALFDNTTGSNNICIGINAGDGLVSGGKNIIIGYEIDAATSSQSNSLNIGNLLFGNGIDGMNSDISSGNIGIGNNDPDYKLDVAGDMQLRKTSGNVKLYIDAAANSGNSAIEFQEGNAFRGSVGYNMDDDYLFFYEDGNVVVKNGNLGVGTTSPAYRLQVGSSGDGSSARANAWNTFSDRTLKKDLSIIDQPLNKVNQISGYYYYWKEGEDKNRQVGIIAQEVEEILPEIVSTDPEGIKSVDYAKLTPLLIEAIKAQQKEIDELRKMVEDLQQ